MAGVGEEEAAGSSSDGDLSAEDSTLTTRRSQETKQEILELQTREKVATPLADKLRSLPFIHLLYIINLQ